MRVYVCVCGHVGNLRNGGTSLGLHHDSASKNEIQLSHSTRILASDNHVGSRDMNK